MGIKAIVSYLNESGKTRRGVRFRVSSVERILKSTIYTGTYAYNRAPKSEAGKAFGVVIIEVPAIVTKAEFERVQVRLAEQRPNRTPPRIVHRASLLGGLLLCPCATSMLAANGNGWKTPSYFFAATRTTAG